MEAVAKIRDLFVPTKQNPVFFFISFLRLVDLKRQFVVKKIQILRFNNEMSGKKRIRLFEIHERRRSPDENQFGEDMRHVAVGRFVSLAGRWRCFLLREVL